eukprot:3939512-Pyramimonas_sp.AAC.1
MEGAPVFPPPCRTCMSPCGRVFPRPQCCAHASPHVLTFYCPVVPFSRRVVLACKILPCSGDAAPAP